VLELHAIASKKTDDDGEFAVAMTAREKHRFLAELIKSSSSFSLHVNTLWVDINTEMSDCSRPADCKSIHDGIRQGCGFVRLNSDVVSVMEDWYLRQLQLHQTTAFAAKDAKYFFTWGTVAASSLILLGKKEDAMAMLETLLNDDLVQKYCKDNDMQEKTKNLSVLLPHLSNLLVESLEHLRRFVDGSQEKQRKIVELYGVRRFVSLLGFDYPNVQAKVCEIIVHLISTIPENRVAFQEQGAVHLLTGLLQNRDKLVQKWSEMALVKLIHELDSASARSK
jgi:hypothetical protein